VRAHTALATLADKVTAAAILPGGCHYPPQPAPAPRSGQVVWRGLEFPDAETDHRVWLVRPAVYLVAPKLNESAYDTAAVDPLVTAVVDLFAASNPDAYRLEVAGDHVQHCAVRSGGAELFAGWYAFRLDVEIKLRRNAGSS
jgi:hypothetical protein